MSVAFPHTPYSDVLDERAEARATRRRRLVDGHTSLAEYHEDKYADRPAPLQQVTNRGYEHLKGKR